MVANIRRFPSVMQERAVCVSKETQGLMRFFRIHYMLMVFFLIGYIAVLYSIVTGIHLVSELFVGVIFFCGALFVLLGILLQDRMLVSLRKSYIQAIKMLVSAVEIRDPYTIGHSVHVANLSLLIFDKLPADIKKDVNRNLVENAGLLHDIGKIGIPEEVLNKTGKLNDNEWRMIRQHAAIGKSLIGNLDCMENIAEWIEYHHERVDGKGYYRISAPKIPLVSRILSTADTYSALVTDRPYRKGKTHHEAMDIIMENAGSQLDPKVVGIFRTLDKLSIEQCRPESLVIEYLDELRKVENYAKNPGNGGGIDMVLHEDLGMLCLQKIFDYCFRENAHLSLAILKTNGLNEVEKVYGYHEADEISTHLSSALFANIRRTDFIVKFRRDLFILAFPQCPIIQAMKLLSRIQGEIEKDQWRKRCNSLVTLDNDFHEFQPTDLKSESKIDAFLKQLSLNGSVNFKPEDFIGHASTEMAVAKLEA